MSAAICHCLYPVQKLFDPHMAAAFASATNGFLTTEVLDRDERLRGSVLISPYDIGSAVEEIRLRAADPRFVQVIMLASAELPYGNPFYDPIWEAAVAAGMPVALHVGNSGRHPPTATGWPSYRLEDEIDQPLAMQGQLASMVSHGAFARFPDLKLVLLGSGVTWLPAFEWRFAKFWRGARIEVPWLTESPIDILRRHVRITTQPFDGPGAGVAIADVLAHLDAPSCCSMPRTIRTGISRAPTPFRAGSTGQCASSCRSKTRAPSTGGCNESRYGPGRTSCGGR